MFIDHPTAIGARLRPALASLAFLLSASCAGIGARSVEGSQLAEPASSDLDLARTADEMFVGTNAQRVAAGLPRLVRSPGLMSAARLQAEQMARMGRMAHELPSAAYPTLNSRLALVSYAQRAAGENVAMGYRDGPAAVAGWMDSASHRANILNQTYTEMGTGAAVARDGRRYYAQVFGRPGRPSSFARAGE